MRRSARINFIRTVLALTAALIGAPSVTLAGPTVTSEAALSLAAAAAGLAVRSPDFVPGGAIALGCVYDESGCHGGNASPALDWSHPPAGTRSFAVLMFDPDARGGWWHWAVFDIPAEVASLRAGAGDPARHLLPLGAIQARNDWGSLGYSGPCPPPGPAHHYRLMIYALRVAKLGLDSSASAAQVAAKVQANALAQAQIVALYSR